MPKRERSPNCYFGLGLAQVFQSHSHSHSRHGFYSTITVHFHYFTLKACSLMGPPLPSPVSTQAHYNITGRVSAPGYIVREGLKSGMVSEVRTAVLKAGGECYGDSNMRDGR